MWNAWIFFQIQERNWIQALREITCFLIVGFYIHCIWFGFQKQTHLGNRKQLFLFFLVSLFFSLRDSTKPIIHLSLPVRDHSCHHAPCEVLQDFPPISCVHLDYYSLYPWTYLHREQLLVSFLSAAAFLFIFADLVETCILIRASNRAREPLTYQR